MYVHEFGFWFAIVETQRPPTGPTKGVTKRCRLFGLTIITPSFMSDRLERFEKKCGECELSLAV